MRVPYTGGSPLLPFDGCCSRLPYVGGGIYPDTVDIPLTGGGIAVLPFTGGGRAIPYAGG